MGTYTNADDPSFVECEMRGKKGVPGHAGAAPNDDTKNPVIVNAVMC